MGSKDERDERQSGIDRAAAVSVPIARERTNARRQALAGKGDAASNGDSGAAHAVGVANYVTIPLAAAITGYSVKAIQRKIEAAVWREGKEFVRAPDGHVLINLQGYHRWVARAPE